MKNSLVLIVGVCLLTASSHHSVQSDLSTFLTSGATIEAIDVRGNSRISSETFHNSFHSRTGDSVSLPPIKSDIQYLYLLGFEEVRVEEEMGVRGGRIVVFQVKEKPLPQKAAP